MNPFRFGPLALDDAFTNRDAELAELGAAMRNGQDIVLYAPRRYGKSSLVWRAAHDAVNEGLLVGYCDLLRITSKETFAAALAKTILGDIDPRRENVLERAGHLFRGLRIRPTIEYDAVDASLAISFRTSRVKADIDETIGGLLELLPEIAADRRCRVVMIFDEFQEIVDLDPAFPNLLRAVFQTQPEVCHVYLGSRRHVLERIFNDENTPFWRSAKKLEVGPIEPATFARFIRSRFQATDRGITDGALTRLLEATGGHPYSTQELAYELWQTLPSGELAGEREVETALAGVLRSEHNHLERFWETATPLQRQVMVALALEPTGSPYAQDYRSAHDLPPASTLQAALDALERKEIAGRRDGVVRIVEPFLADWILRERRQPSLNAQLRLGGGADL